MKTCIYARKSTRKVNQTNTIKNQIEICNRYARENNLEVVDVKVDIGSGRDELNRDEINNLINDGVKGNYQCVIMKGISRLYRNTRKGLELIEKLHMNGIRIIVIEEDFDSKHNIYSTGSLDISRVTMYLMFAEMESDKISERVKLTQLEKIYQGMWVNPSNVPYGYDYNPETKKLKVNNIQAEVISSIFHLYLGDNTIQEIIQYLSNQNINAPKSNFWRADTIRYILKNQVYIGSVKYTKFYKEITIHTASKRDYVENAHDPIIEEEVFKSVQIKLNTNKKQINKDNQTILKGLIFCSSCNSIMTRRKYQYTGEYFFYCSGYIRYGKGFCSSNKINSDGLEKQVRIQGRNYIKQIDKMPLLQKQNNNIKNKIDNNRWKFENIFDKLLNGSINNKKFNKINKELSEELNALILKHNSKEAVIHKFRSIRNMDGSSSFFKQDIPEKSIIKYIIKKVEVSNGKVTVYFF